MTNTKNNIFLKVCNTVYQRQIIIFLSGDTGFDAVTQWDENEFGEGDTEKGEAKPGPVFLELAKLLFDEAMSGNTPHHEKIHYN